MNDNSINITNDEFDDYEDWEAFVELHENEDYPGLVKFCEQIFKKSPNDPYSQYYLGAAYVLNGQYEKAIKFMSKHHKEFPENMDFQHVILDALFSLGKDENDYHWTKKPVVFRMSREIMDRCYKFLKPKRKPRTIDEVYLEFSIRGYVLFGEEDLLQEILKDDRFIVSKINDDSFAEVRVTSLKK